MIVRDVETAPQEGVAVSGDDRRLLHRRALPSGRLLLVLRGSDSASEELELLAPDGALEVRIVCGPAGPQVVVSATRLELDASALAVRCRELDLQVDEAMALRSQELRVTTAGDVHVNGAGIRLNCDEVSAPKQGDE